MLFIGLDPIDPYVRHPRPASIAFMDETLSIRFESWRQDTEGLDGFVSAADCVLAIDGPQGLASPGETMRASERRLGTPGKTPAAMPVPGSKPFAGYLRGSIELFAALLAHPRFKLADGPSSSGRSNLLEVYPGKAWPVLSRHAPLGDKERRVGREARLRLLESYGVQFVAIGGLPTHDELDAALAAYIASLFAHGQADLIGLPPTRDTDGGVREGFIVQPRPSFP